MQQARMYEANRKKRFSEEAAKMQQVMIMKQGKAAMKYAMPESREEGKS